MYNQGEKTKKFCWLFTILFLITILNIAKSWIHMKHIQILWLLSALRFYVRLWRYFTILSIYALYVKPIIILCLKLLKWLFWQSCVVHSARYLTPCDRKGASQRPNQQAIPEQAQQSVPTKTKWWHCSSLQQRGAQLGTQSYPSSSRCGKVP